MHDPMVVAHNVVLPIPRRKWRAAKSEPRWTFHRRRRTNTENLGEPVYRWWRPDGYELIVAGWVIGLYKLATIWHVEPKGRDSGEVCKHWANGKPLRRWKWHVHHWSVQIHLLQGVRARLFDRCALCGRKGRPNVSHQWDGPGVGWRKWRSRPGLYHSQCSALGSLQQVVADDEATIRHLVAALRLQTDLPEPVLVELLTASSVPDTVFPFNRRRRLWTLMGYERDDDYKLVPDCTGAENCRSKLHIHGCLADTDDVPCRAPIEHLLTREAARA